MTMRRCLILLLAVLAGCGSTSEPTISEKLAVLDGDNAGVPMQYETALDQLSSRCDDHPDPERVADMAVVSREKLAEAGIDESLLEILQHVNQAIPEGGDPDQGCAVYFGSYVFVRRGGQ
jgi:hypothetical protein